MKNKKHLKSTAQAAMFLAIGIVLPFFTAQIKEIGDTLLPMHLPVMLCGLICGAKYGFLIGIILPLMRSMLFSMPPIYPNAVWMAFELAAYGSVIGYLYGKSVKKDIKSIYISLVISQISGRLVWGVVKTILLGIADKPFGLRAFLIGGFVDALPGIILQLVIVPFVMTLINRKYK